MRTMKECLLQAETLLEDAAYWLEDAAQAAMEEGRSEAEDLFNYVRQVKALQNNIAAIRGAHAPASNQP